MIRTEQLSAGRVHGHVTHADKPRAGVLVLPTVTGVDGPTQVQTQMLAEAGFTALIWDPYPGEEPPVDVPSAMPRAAKLHDGLVEGMSDCISHLLGPMGLPAVAVLGFCLGGRYAILLAAADRRLKACVAYYPSIRLPNKPNEALDAVALAAEIRCPVHLVHGTADTVFTEAAFVRVRDALDKRPVATVVQVHPGAVHSFMRPDLQSVPANASATRLSWPPVVSFIGACVGEDSR